MRKSASVITFVALLFLFVSLVSAATPTSFCKCVCGSNSTIIPLNGRAPGSGETASKKTGTCTDCNRQFCLEYNLPICKNTKDEEITTECFQRDSLKDQMVVYTFILLTVGLLVYAAFEPYFKKTIEVVQERRSYMPVSSNQGNT